MKQEGTKPPEYEVCPRCGEPVYWGKFLELMVCEGPDCPWFMTPEGDEYFRMTLEDRKNLP